jgi:hypothetical protein
MSQNACVLAGSVRKTVEGKSAKFESANRVNCLYKGIIEDVVAVESSVISRTTSAIV